MKQYDPESYEFLELVLKDIVAFFKKRDSFDERFIIQNLTEVIKHWEEYVGIMEEYQCLEPSLVAFTLFVFGDNKKTHDCLKAAEKRYKLEIEKGSVHPDQIRESIFKSIVFALEERISFSKAFLQIIIVPSISLKIRLKKIIKKVSLNTCVNEVLSQNNIFIGPEDLFAYRLVQV